MADLADADLLLPLTKFLTADNCAAVYSTAVQTTGTLGNIKQDRSKQMIRLKTLLIVLLISFVLTSCFDREGELTIINGDIKEFYTNQPIPEFKIGLAMQKNWSIFAPEIIIDTIISDNSGKISHSFENTTGYHYFICYLENFEYPAFDDILIQSDKKNKIEIISKHHNKLIISLRNINHNYKKLWISGNSGLDLIYDSIFIDTLIIYPKSIPDNFLDLEFRPYNENMWIDRQLIDTNIFVSCPEIGLHK